MTIHLIDATSGRRITTWRVDPEGGDVIYVNFQPYPVAVYFQMEGNVRTPTVTLQPRGSYVLKGGAVYEAGRPSPWPSELE